MNEFSLVAISVLVLCVAIFAFTSRFNIVIASISSALSAILIRFLEDPAVSGFEKIGWKENIYSPAMIYILLFIFIWGVLFSALSYLPSKKESPNRVIKFLFVVIFSVITAYSVLNVVCISLPAFLSSQDSQIKLKNSLVCVGCKNQFLLDTLPSAIKNTAGQILTPGTSTEVIILPENFKFLSTSPLLESRMLNILNQIRSENGVAELSGSSELNELALKYASEIIKARRFSHIDFKGSTPSQRARDLQIGFDYFGENLAIAPTVERASEAMLVSASHKENIVSPIFRKIGIAVVNVAPNEIIVVEEFSN